jgi:thiamine-monophosphate kinase
VSTAKETGEFGLIDRIARIMPGSPDVIEGIGDDCAVIRIGDRVVLASTDLFIEDVHFRWSYMTGEDIGWKAATAGLSDIAAMGGRPICLLVSLACPGETDADALEAIARGIADAARTHGAAVVGGDTTRHPTGVVIDIVALGEAVDGRYVTRARAKPGDVFMVTGTLGGSAAGLHALENGHDAPSLVQAHIRPNAHVAQGQWLAQQPGVHAMIDISDGLVQDAGHIATRSGVRIDIDSGNVPIHPEVSANTRVLKLDLVRVALSSGEEYQLGIAVDSVNADAVESAFSTKFSVPLTRIGAVRAGGPAVTVDGERIPDGGFDHFA